MTLHTLVFIGRSGSGKGTQGKLLQEFFTKNDTTHPIFYLETGARFREFIKEPGYTQDLSRELYGTGLRQPDFLAIWTWATIFVEKMKGGEHLFIDGTPRSYSEALALDSALKFYKKRAHVIYLDVDNTCATKRLVARGRPDDVVPEQVVKRLAWFDNDVMPLVDYYRTNPDYEFLHINGDQPVEMVQKELLDRLGLVG